MLLRLPPEMRIVIYPRAVVEPRQRISDGTGVYQPFRSRHGTVPNSFPSNIGILPSQHELNLGYPLVLVLHNHAFNLKPAPGKDLSGNVNRSTDSLLNMVIKWNGQPLLCSFIHYLIYTIGAISTALE